MLTPAEGTIAELALVLLLGREGGLADARRGGVGQDRDAGGHVDSSCSNLWDCPRHRAMVEIVWLASVGVGLKVRWMFWATSGAFVGGVCWASMGGRG